MRAASQDADGSSSGFERREKARKPRDGDGGPRHHPLMTVIPPDHLVLDRIDSPIGPLNLAFDGDGRLRGLGFDGEGAGPGAAGDLIRAMRREYPQARLRQGPAPTAADEALRTYFAGERSALDSIEWSLDGARSAGGFQARVWRALTGVPAGTTISYGEMARRAGDPHAIGLASAAQATGAALNRNPIALVLACHRVVGADGSMTGFGGGLERKTWLLRHEGALLI